MELLRKCGIDVEWRADQLVCSSVNLPLDVMLVRDDDIPGTGKMDDTTVRQRNFGRPSELFRNLGQRLVHGIRLHR